MTVPGAKYPKTVKGGSYLDDSKELRCANRIASRSRLEQTRSANTKEQMVAHGWNVCRFPRSATARTTFEGRD